MQQAIPSISPEVKQRLEEQGFKPFKYRPLPNYANPHSSTYWVTNALIMGVSLLGRHFAGKQQSVRILWSTAFLSVPIYAVGSSAKLDGIRQNGFYRKPLEDRLEHHPLTRRAWERALKTNKEYLDTLREEIAQLEAEYRR